MERRILIYPILFVSMLSCQGYGRFWEVSTTQDAAAKPTACDLTKTNLVSGPAVWVKSIPVGSAGSEFKNVATDSSCNIFAVGYQANSGSYSYGSGISVNGAYASGNNAVIVKYDATGNIQWAKSTLTAPNQSVFYGVAVDAAGNVYAAGSQVDNGNYNYGSGVIAGAYANAGTGLNAILIKYDSSGNTQWAKTVVVATANSQFNAVAVDGSGNIYAAGYQTGNSNFDYGSGNLASGAAGSSNSVLVKYNASGSVIWAKTTVTAPAMSAFNAVAADSSGNAYAAGYQNATGGYDYGSGLVTGSSGNNNVVLLKYNSSGSVIWANTLPGGGGDSSFLHVSVDTPGNVYAGGFQYGSANFNYGAGNIAGPYGGGNATLIKYNSAGTNQWSKTLTSGPNTSQFNGSAVDSQGRVFSAGFQYGINPYNYGSGNTAGSFSTGNNIIAVKYDSSGAAQWSRSVSVGSNVSTFNNSAADAAGNIYMVGFQTGTGAFTYGPGASASGAFSGLNAVIVRYAP